MYQDLWLNCQVSSCTGDSTQKTGFKKKNNQKTKTKQQTKEPPPQNHNWQTTW